MSAHRSLREIFSGHDDDGPSPVFEPSQDPTLMAFGQIFDGSGLVAFDASKHLRTDAWSPIYDCETETLAEGAAEREQFVAIWTPVWPGTDPVTGFRTGQDSAYLGSTPTVAMPQDERTAALLLLVTTTFVHLSARREEGTLLVQGAVDITGNEGYRFVELVPARVEPSTFGTEATSSPESPARE
jgi:hypothetical protein